MYIGHGNSALEIRKIGGLRGRLTNRGCLPPLNSSPPGARPWRLKRPALAKSRAPQTSWASALRGYHDGPGEMSIKTTTLDQRLYAWLLEPDDHRFERAFSAYYSVAFPALVRRLARVSGWQDVQLEELVQDALLRFFDKVGRGRREASVAVRDSLAHIRPINLGPFHERQVKGWTRDVASFIDAAMGFQPPSTDDPDNATWKATISSLADQIPRLQRQGSHLLHSVRVELRWSYADEGSLDAIRKAPEAVPFEIDSDEGLAEALDEDSGVPQDVEKRFVDEIMAKSVRAEVTERDHPGTLLLIQGAWVVICNIPRLRVPTNGYLFEIATTIFLDECKRRGRKKRGGGGMRIDQEEAVPAGNTEEHPLETMAMDVDTGDERFSDMTLMSVRASAGFSPPAVDPTAKYEQDEFFQKFYDYLRLPVDEAIEILEQAQSRGRALTERRKLASMTQKFDRTMSVLTAMGEGYTQEQAAQRLGLTRNQVKYILELVQESYARFASEGVQTARHLSADGGQAHG